MSQWIDRFLKNEIVNRTDKTDKPIDGRPLSVRTLGFLDKKVKNNPETGTDKTDKPTNEGHLSVLSVRPLGLFDEKMDETSKKYTDNTDRFKIESNMSVLSQHEFEERLAIVEHDGGQTPLQAHSIAYLDAFILVLTALPATGSQRDWLAQRIQTSLAWIEAQHFPTLN